MGHVYTDMYKDSSAASTNVSAVTLSTGGPHFPFLQLVGGLTLPYLTDEHAWVGKNTGGPLQRKHVVLFILVGEILCHIMSCAIQVS